jgi:FkbM family methyltransferase
MAKTSIINKLRIALNNLGLPSLIRFQFYRYIQFSSHVTRLTSKRLPYPVFARPGSSDYAVFRQIFAAREYSCLDGLTNPRLVLDCGANVGYSSAYFLSHFPNCFVVAVEPDAANFALLERNLLPYKGRYKTVRAAVWPRAEKLRFNTEFSGVGQEWERTVERSDDSVNTECVKAITIPALIEISGFDRVSILKVDIEGAERELFGSGSDEWLDKVNNIVIELHGPGCSQAFFDAIKGRHFDVSVCQELTVCLSGSLSIGP